MHTGFFDLETNPVYRPGEAELGKRLFFDPRMAGDRKMSCATCHQPDKAWTDGLPRAKGLGGRELARNTPSLFNTVRNIPQNFFWDGRAQTLPDAIVTALQSRVEMNRDPKALAEEIRSIPEYEEAFRTLYGADAITPQNLARAISAFIKTEIVIGQTPFDRFGKDPHALDAAQKRGLMLFVSKARCLFCHAGPYFSDDSHHSNGLKPAPDLDDPGRFAIEADPVYWRAFKTPPLRNVALTAPYMHDGSLKTLEDVIEFYDRGGDTPDRDEKIKELKLTPREKADLVAFLKALTGEGKAVAAPVLPVQDQEPQLMRAPFAPPNPAALFYSTASRAGDPYAPLGADGYPTVVGGELVPPRSTLASRAWSAGDTSKMKAGLKIARRYADINEAFKDGYRLEGHFGNGMGVHMMNLGYILSDEVLIEKPEFLTYSRSRGGRWQLLQVGYIHRGLHRVKLFDSPEAKGHFHDMNICSTLKDNVMADAPPGSACDGPGMTRIGPIWMMHFAVNIYNEKGLFADYFSYADDVSATNQSFTFFGRRVTSSAP